MFRVRCGVIGGRLRPVFFLETVVISWCAVWIFAGVASYQCVCISARISARISALIIDVLMH